jgi:hypothetical protein
LHVFSAETPRQGEVGVGLFNDSFYRSPGALNFNVFPLVLSIGVYDRLEAFVSWQAYKRVDAADILTGKVGPGEPLVPARLSNGEIGYFNESPFIDQDSSDGSGDIFTGFKVNLLSERRGCPISLAVQPFLKSSSISSRNRLLSGLTPGTTDGGVDAIITKGVPGGGSVTGNLGLLWSPDKLGVRRQNQVNWGVGTQIPIGSPKVSLIGEMLGQVFYGSKEISPLVNVVSPIDAYVGLRVTPEKWITISGAGGFNLRSNGSTSQYLRPPGTYGWILGITIQRKINRPPLIECTAERTRVLEGEVARIRASVFDSDDGRLALTWRTRGGRLTQEGATVQLDTSGLEPGVYPVIGEVSDGSVEAICSVDIHVEKNKLPPVISCAGSPDHVSIRQSVTLKPVASDPNLDELAFKWAVDGKPVLNNRPLFEFGSVGRETGRHLVEVTVTDVDGLESSCTFEIMVDPVEEEGSSDP